MSTNDSTYDAVIVGASLAGCATAIGLGRVGLRVAVVEKQPDEGFFAQLQSSGSLRARGL